MSWIEHYRQQAKAHREEAHRWATHGHETRAKLHLLSAETYDELADEAEKRAEERALRSKPR